MKTMISLLIGLLAAPVFAASLAVSAKTQFAQVTAEKKIAYRSFGKGSTIIFANRFRGTMDSWDPAFLDAVAKNNRVIIFDYSGVGRSTGKAAESHMDLGGDIPDLAKALKIQKFAVAGWSLGGFAAQIAMTEFPEMITHGIIIGSRPPGKDLTPPQKIFFDTALKPVNDLKDEEILFFNPQYPESVAAAKASHERIAQRKSDFSVPFTPEQYGKMIQLKGFSDDSYGTLEKMKQSKIPILSIIGENDICFPAEDWFKTKGQLTNVTLVYLPKSGHGPQHQYPELSARHITDFVSLTAPAPAAQKALSQAF